jgi:ABC-type Mn2+/Zn2+ transport system permease subunit
MSKEYRIQYEAALTILFMVVFYTSMMILTFDDDQEEVSEFFNTFLFYCFVSFLFYF